MLDVVEQPFRHVVIDGWWPEELLRAASNEFPEPEDPRWGRFANARESKSQGGLLLWGDRTREYFGLLASRADEIAEAFGIPGLTMFADIAPEFNRTVIFETSDHSWHGHPIPAARPRRSLAAYMFTDARPVDFANQSTVFLKIEAVPDA